MVVLILLSSCHRYAVTPSPPLTLISAVLNILSCEASVSPEETMSRLKKTSLLPSISTDGQLFPGVVGLLLAGQETVAGEFPSLLAFLKLVTTIANQVRTFAYNHYKSI